MNRKQLRQLEREVHARAVVARRWRMCDRFLLISSVISIIYIWSIAT
jgi:hypothetical protein